MFKRRGHWQIINVALWARLGQHCGCQESGSLIIRVEIESREIYFLKSSLWSQPFSNYIRLQKFFTLCSHSFFFLLHQPQKQMNPFHLAQSEKTNCNNYRNTPLYICVSISWLYKFVLQTYISHISNAHVFWVPFKSVSDPFSSPIFSDSSTFPHLAHIIEWSNDVFMHVWLLIFIHNVSPQLCVYVCDLFSFVPL